MPRPTKRPQPRHLDADKPRLTVPRTSATVAGLVAAALLTVVAVGSLTGGSVSSGLAAVRTFGTGDGTQDRGNDAARPAPTSPDPVAEAPAPTRFRVVEATRLQPAPEPEPKSPARSRLAERVERSAASATIAEFGVAMLNILGSQHTAGGKGGYASGTSRALTATRMLLARDVSVVGFSEIQGDQLSVFLNNAPSFEAYPGAALGSSGIPQTVAWDTRLWRLVEADAIYIPFSGQIRPQPVVRLESVATGAEIWVMNVHNSPQGMEGERDRAEAVEVAKINELAATGVPIVVTGDFNEKQEILCRITASTPLVSAVGGGNCYPPPQPMRVDWIFASPELDLASYSVTRESPVPSITDHAVLFSRMSLS